MIARIWRGWTSKENADAYRDVVVGHVVPGIAAREIKGLRGPQLLRRDVSQDEVEFMTIILFDDWDGVTQFAGAESTTPVVPQLARDLLSRFDPESVHYEVVSGEPGAEANPANERMLGD